MSLNKICSKCGVNIIKDSDRYCKECYSKRKSTMAYKNKLYSKNREDKEIVAFYNTKAWQKMATKIRGKFLSCCAICFINSFRELNKEFEIINTFNYFKEDAKRRNLIHHIIELKEDESKSLQENNLICVCEKHHKKIHSVYEKGNKEMLQEELRRLVEWWNLIGGVGKKLEEKRIENAVSSRFKEISNL